MQMTRQRLQREQKLYVCQATSEYLTSLLVRGSFLAALTRELGFSDSLTGILTSITSLGCLFQLLSIVFRINAVKKTVIIGTAINQLLFVLFYLLPLVELPVQVKPLLLVAFSVLAYLFYYFVYPKKTAWLMSKVDNAQRGTFTARKEIIFLLAGMIFSYLMGMVSDNYSESGNIQTSFVIFAGVLFALSVVNVFSMAFVADEIYPKTAPKSLCQIIKEVFGTRDVVRLSVLFSLYFVAFYTAIPFYSSYQINELGFSLKQVALVNFLYYFLRISVSNAWGKFADRRNFAVMLEKCFLFMALAFGCVTMAMPFNGKLMFMLFYSFYGVALGGINSAQVNMVFDYVSPEKRGDALAVVQAVAGLCGFLATLCISPLVDYIQNNGNRLFGIQVYAQQVVSFISVIYLLAAMVYLRLVFLKKGHTARIR